MMNDTGDTSAEDLNELFFDNSSAASLNRKARAARKGFLMKVNFFRVIVKTQANKCGDEAKLRSYLQYLRRIKLSIKVQMEKITTSNCTFEMPTDDAETELAKPNPFRARRGKEFKDELDLINASMLDLCAEFGIAASELELASDLHEMRKWVSIEINKFIKFSLCEGTPGPVGKDGINGEKGSTGQNCPTGPQGFPGPRGTPGINGNVGELGVMTLNRTLVVMIPKIQTNIDKRLYTYDVTKGYKLCILESMCSKF